MSTGINVHAPELAKRRLARFRRWHKWAGLLAGAFLLLTGASGIVLNYKQAIFSKLGIELKRERERDTSPLPATRATNKVVFTPGTCVAGGRIDFAGALALAQAEWGDVRLERMELRSDRSSVTFRFRKEGGAELWVDAADGRHFLKGEYERIGKLGADGAAVRMTDWSRILIDLHTGRICGGIGKVVVTFVAALLLFLSLSGFYLWLKPLLSRGRNPRKQSKVAQPLPS